MFQRLNGIIKIDNYDCQFYYDSETEKIIIYMGNKGITVQKEMSTVIGQPLGKNGKYIFFKLGGFLFNDTMTWEEGGLKPSVLADQICSVEYCIEDYKSNSSYTEMRMQFSELDYFIPATGRCRVTEDEIIFSREKESLYSFDVQYADTTVHVSFDTKIAGNENVKATAETISELSLTFPKTDDMDYLTRLYDGVRGFFSFVCNRQNIDLRSAVLIGKYPRITFKEEKMIDTEGHTQQTIFFSQKYIEPEEEIKQIKKVPNIRMFSVQLKELFQLFLEEKKDDIAVVNWSVIHHSFKHRNLIDLEHSINLTSSFEYYVRTLLPEMSSSETREFYNDMQELLEKYIRETTGKKKNKAKSLKKSLKPEVSLEEKIKKAYEGYSEWQPLKDILFEWFGEDISNLAKEANLWRNELAHDKREYQPKVETIDAVRLVEHINYCIVLRKAGYDDENIKAIISKILTR